MKGNLSLRMVIRTIPFLLLLIGLGTYSFVKVRAYKQRSNGKIAYTLTQQRSTTLTNQQPHLDWTSVRAVRTNGDFVETRNLDGRQLYQAFSRDGKFLTRTSNADKLVYVSDVNNGWTEEGLKNSQHLRKDKPIEWVRGIKCYVMRVESEGGAYDEYYVSPDLNFILYSIMHTPQADVVLETTSLAIGEPEISHFQNLPINLPILTSPNLQKRGSSN